ncbi:hypothetical protein [Sphingobacterium spiritivorum]
MVRNQSTVPNYDPEQYKFNDKDCCFLLSLQIFTTLVLALGVF